MDIINKITGEVLTKYDVRRRHPHITFGFSEAGLAGTDYALINKGDYPSYDPRYHRVDITEPVIIDGEYHADYILVPATDDFDVLLEEKIAEINSACEKKICTHFLSDALGAFHRYTSDRVDQMNIQGNVIDAMNGNHCLHICYAESNDGYTDRQIIEHTPEQMLQVGRDLKVHVWHNLVLADLLKKAAIEAAVNEDFESLVAVVWDNY